jgi:hypothetical protein
MDTTHAVSFVKISSGIHKLMDRNRNIQEGDLICLLFL